ncbi:Holliday junction branch migration protein RuvA [Algisphaera agarilytica]|uniref:Holliday junction branch migration complex subunit RuvA n=1 Tax=Algisphaera agarilytica TaxID=1385975 RepID=A0A7X0H6R5_9BACT|nr:Holliday junction branch migration protein RuvA [Algisphaera agarilytica]MBB6430102.1 Holliday junction DNA helicase RuvA [Algisphaera agarilytica]
MISRITGTLDAIEPDKAFVDPGQGLVYEVMLPAFAATRLSVKTGQTVTLHTFQFIESTAQGATMFPRLAGFLTEQDKQFFELFVTCKGIGHKRALRAMILDTNTLASAIADRDAKLIQTMPEVGKKLAETIVVTLRDKVDQFVSAAAYGAGAEGPSGQGAEGAPASGGGSLARETLEVLLQLGENRTQAVQWIDRVLSADDAPTDVQDVVAAVYRLKAGA